MTSPSSNTRIQPGSCAGGIGKTEPKAPLSRQEHRFMTNLMIVLHTLLSDKDKAAERLIRYGYDYVRRDIALLIALDNKLQQEMLETLPDNYVRRFQRMAQEAQIVVEYPGASRKGRQILIDVEDLGAITEAAMQGECAMCMREGREVKRCRLREALLTVAPPETVGTLGCEYRSPASQLLHGDDITI